MTTTLEPPPLRQDRLVQTWAVTSGISQAGDVAWIIALAWTATSIGGPAQAGLVLGLETIPRAATLFLGGTLADRLDARAMMVATNAARVAVLLAGAAIAVAGTVTIALLAAIAIAFGICDGLYQPASATLPRQLVRTEDLTPTAAMFQLSHRLAAFAGAPLGGLLVAQGGIATVMLVDAASYLAISVVLATVLRPRFPRPPSEGASVRADLAAGMSYVRRTPHIRTLVVALSGLNLFVGPATALGLTLRVRAEGWGATSLGLMEAAAGVAAAVAALGAMRWRPLRPARVGLLMLVAQAAAIALIGFAPAVGVVGAMVVIGVTAGFASAFLSGAFQTMVDASYLGRTSGLVGLGDDVLMPAAMTGFGALAAGAGLVTACLVTAVAFAALVTWSAFRPGIDPPTPISIDPGSHDDPPTPISIDPGSHDDPNR